LPFRSCWLAQPAGFDPFEPTAGVAAAVAPLRFVRPPFVAITPTSLGETQFTAAIRMNRELPRNRDKSVDATIHMQGATARITVAHIGPLRWHCYLQPIELFIPKVLRHPHEVHERFVEASLALKGSAMTGSFASIGGRRGDGFQSGAVRADPRRS
jgi:hypothetical protein